MSRFEQPTVVNYIIYLIMALALTTAVGITWRETKAVFDNNGTIPIQPEPEYKIIKGIVTDVEFMEVTRLLIFQTHHTKFILNETLIIFDSGWANGIELGEMYEFKYLLDSDGIPEKTPASVLRFKPSEDGS